MGALSGDGAIETRFIWAESAGIGVVGLGGASDNWRGVSLGHQSRPIGYQATVVQSAALALWHQRQDPR